MTDIIRDKSQMAAWAYLLDSLTPEQVKEYVLILIGAKEYSLRGNKNDR